MPILFCAALMLLLADAPRMLPVIPSVPTPWMEQGNRHARRRDKKLRRS